MKRSGYEAKRKGIMVRRCLAIMTAITSFVSLAFPNYGILPRAGASDEEILSSLAEPGGKNKLLASFDFNNGKLQDLSAEGVVATLLGPDAGCLIDTDTENSNSYLNLTNSDAYISLEGGILKDLTEMTVEMSVLTKDITSANWAFFAAPNADRQEVDDEHYLGVLINDKVKVERFANGRENDSDFYGDWSTDEWHTIRVVFGENSTDLYIDDNEPITKSSTKQLTDCFGDNGALWFGHAAWGAGEGFNGLIDDIKIWDSADPDHTDPIASFDFGDKNDRLKDSSGNNVSATCVGGEVQPPNLIHEDGYLDLNNKQAYLSLMKADGSGVLDNMAEVTVEMSLYMIPSNDTQWPFYAAPVGSIPSRYPQKEHYLSVHLANNAISARRYDGARPADTPNNAGLSAVWTANEWYKVKVAYEAGKTTLSVTNEAGETVTKEATDLSANLWNCLGENSFLWFGYSGWGGTQYFNGYIDDIRIWGTSRDDININDVETIEDEHIITKDVIDPANTKVNMFDYWVFGEQNDKDYGLGNRPIGDLINGKINFEHLFLFDGSESISLGDDEKLGLWNRYNGTPTNGDEPNWGIVQNTLDPNNGYPRLALDNGIWAEPTNETLKKLWESEEKRNESLEYLFNPDETHKGKASYPDVTGLFRINDEGYYYFRSQEVFAELNKQQEYNPNLPKTSVANNHITLYDTPWRQEYARGQFFPFNDWSKLFYEVNGNVGQSDELPDVQPLNHWFGMTIETTFMQPADGTLYSGEPMTFEFSGDDDVWIFIDDVLVADVGGNHKRIRVKIDYSTGKIEYTKGLEYTGMKGTEFYDPSGTTATLRGMFEKALGAGNLKDEDWNGNTFGNNTIHTLKFFYLERGNAASNCNISFNLQEPIVDNIRKVDQNGNPLADAEFALYKATLNRPVLDDWWKHTAADFTKIGDDPIATTVSNDNGYAPLTKTDGEPLDLKQSEYYILEETKTPEGYRENPLIVLQYHENTNTLTVVNKYEVGAYASFLAEWASKLDVYFADNDGTPLPNAIDDDELKNGLAVVVPVVMINDIRRPMYGSNTLGWNTVTPDTEDDFVKALAEAAFRQISDTDPKTQHWYLRWNGTQLKGHMENLPGDATRYSFNGGEDGELVTLFLSAEALNNLGVRGNYADDDERYLALSKALAGKDAAALAAQVEILRDLKIIFTDDFVKYSRTVIYVPNEQQELRVRKLDEDGNPLAGAVFALFDTARHAADGKAIDSLGVKAYGTTDDNGELIFSPQSEKGNGYINWYFNGNSGTTEYWLKELTAPAGYELNESLVRVEVSRAGIYANATGYDAEGNLLTGDAAENDGIKVDASLGGLTQTLVKYAEGIVDETLKYITITEQTSNNANSWVNGESEELTYGTDGYAPAKTFTADNGYIRIMPRQTAATSAPDAHRDDLIGIDLDGLFRLVNTVVVTDRPITDSLTVTKTVEVPEGEEIDKDAQFGFTVTLTDKTFNRTYIFGDKTVSFVNGIAEFTLCHGESVTFTLLPAGIGYTVTEDETEGYTATFTGATGTISADGNAKADFTNTKIIDDSDDTSSKPDDTSSDPDNTSSDPDSTSSDPDNTSSDPDNTSSDPNNTSSDPDSTSSNPDDPGDPGDQEGHDSSHEDNITGDSDKQDDPINPEESNEQNTSDKNPNTGFDVHSFFWGIVLTLSLIVAVYPQRKRSKIKK